MAADKEIMKAIETLRLDRPGRAYKAQVDGPFVWALDELAKTFREEAELWSRSGARGWKSSEADAYLVAQRISEVAAQLDNAGGGAALSISSGEQFPDNGCTHGQGCQVHPDSEGLHNFDDLEAELRESAKRVDALPGTGASGLDALIADSIAERRGHVRDELLPDGHPARSPLPMAPGTRVEIKGDDVTAYLKGEINDIPGSPPLTPNSITSAPEADDPFAPPGECCENMLAPDEDPAPWCDGRQDVDHTGHTGPCKYRAHLRADHDARAGLIDAVPDVSILRQTDAMPKTWESETMTADGHLLPGVARTAAPLLGQPGDAGTGYSHSYIPAGGRRFTYAELLTPVPAASLPPHLSHSQGNTIGDCGVKYRLQRVEALPQVPQWANVGGSAFHAAVEAWERSLVYDGGDLALDADSDAAWKIAFEAEIARVSASSPVPVSVWRASRKGAEGRQWWEVNGPPMLRRYLDARPNRRPITIDSGGAPAIEWEVKADVPTPYGPLPFVAKLDSVKLSADGTAVVIEDYKTSYERPTDTTQLGDYANVLMLSGANLHGATRILGTYFDARRGEWTEPVDLLAAHPFEAFQYRVTTAYAQRRALITGPTPARPSSYCGGCSVRYACPIMASRS